MSSRRQSYPTEAEWKAARRTLITATDASTIIGVNPWKRPLQLYAEKRGLADDHIESEAAEWGLLLEDPIAARYHRLTRRAVLNPADECGRYYLDINTNTPWIGATIDREVQVVEGAEPAPADGAGVLEIKTTSTFRKDDWNDEPPIFYQVQVQHQLAVTGHKWASIAVLIGGQRFRYFDIVRNDDFIEQLLDVEHDFFQRLQSGEPPEPEGTEGDTSALRALFKKEQEAVVSLPASLLEWDNERLRADEMIKAGEELRRLADNHIMAALGDAAHGMFPNGVGYSWRTVTRREHVVKGSTYRQLRRMGGKA